MRVILYTGKGGVGKSTLSAATAVRCARQGSRTLLVSSDLAHNVSDILDRPVGDRCVEIEDNLFALEIDVLNEIKEHWDPIQEYLSNLLGYMGTDSVVAEEVALVPGMDSIFLLTRILREIESGGYDTVVMDCAPTGATLRLLSLTDATTTKFNQFLKLERQLLRVVRPASRKVKTLREVIPEDRFYESVSVVAGHIGRLSRILCDPECSSMRLVLNPDRIALAESKRAYTYFALFGFPVDGIFINKVYPDAVADGYLGPWRELQQRYMASIRTSFMDTRLFPVEHLEGEPVGLDSLDRLGRTIFQDTPPDEVLSPTRTVTFEREGDKTLLRFVIPDLDKASLDLGRKDNELLISAGGHSRVFTLPDTLLAAEVEGASYRDDRLTVTFGSAGEGEGKRTQDAAPED
jgi:arsenite-transporting ATPase